MTAPYVQRMLAIENLVQALDLQAELRPESTATWFEGAVQTYQQFAANTRKVANALQAEGIIAGDRIAYIGKNSDSYFELFFGAARIGAVMAPIGWRLAAEEAKWIVHDCQAKIAFIGTECAELRSVLEADPGKDLRRTVDLENRDGRGVAFVQWRDAAAAGDANHKIARDDIVLQLYTSGTTGRPKGAMLTHWNLVNSQIQSFTEPLGWNEWRPDDSSLMAMPIAHIGGSGWGIRGLFHGARNIIMRDFDPAAALDLIEQFQVSKLFMVPAALQIVIRLPKARSVDYSKLRYILYGASPIPLDLLKECLEVFGCGFCQQYGMTETTGTVCHLPPSDHDVSGNVRMRSAGKPNTGVEIAIVDPDGRKVPAMQTGEICIRSENNMAGYWNLEEATRATLSPDGWLKSGDAGYLDEDGYLYIMDRVKDMIVSGAENVYPAEVENALYGHPDIAEVAVIGVPDEKWGEAVKAIVVLKEGAHPDSDGIRKFARQRIAGFKVPKTVDFVSSLPRNASGKILKRELRAPFWQGQERNVN